MTINEFKEMWDYQFVILHIENILLSTFDEVQFCLFLWYFYFKLIQTHEELHLIFSLLSVQV